MGEGEPAEWDEEHVHGMAARNGTERRRARAPTHLTGPTDGVRRVLSTHPFRRGPVRPAQVTSVFARA